MTAKRKTAEFVASQLAGSCRLEGIKVTTADERLMVSIVDGTVDGKRLASQLAKRYREQNRRV